MIMQFTLMTQQYGVLLGQMPTFLKNYFVVWIIEICTLAYMELEMDKFRDRILRILAHNLCDVNR